MAISSTNKTSGRHIGEEILDNLNGSGVNPAGKIMNNHGGKRKGAGRPITREPWERVQFSLSQETAILLRDLIPAYQRSVWVDGIIRKALKARKAK